jgi:hypothetical protein
VNFRFFLFSNAFSPFFVTNILFLFQFIWVEVQRAKNLFGVAEATSNFFRPSLNGFLSEFRKISKMLMRVTRKVQYFLEIYETF